VKLRQLIEMGLQDDFVEVFQTIYAGAVICFGGLIFAGIRMMSGRFQDAIPGLFGALFGAGVLGWGAGWIGDRYRLKQSRRKLTSSSELYPSRTRPFSPEYSTTWLPTTGLLLLRPTGRVLLRP
jgi:hypothetical protein